VLKMNRFVTGKRNADLEPRRFQVYGDTEMSGATESDSATRNLGERQKDLNRREEEAGEPIPIARLAKVVGLFFRNSTLSPQTVDPAYI
jgi:hypothetical protein